VEVPPEGGFSGVEHGGVPQNLIRAHGNQGGSPGQVAAVDFESGKQRRDGYTALFLIRPT